MRYLPVGLDLRDRAALVIGAGGEIPAKVDRLVACGARVTVIATAPDPAIEARAIAGSITLHRREAEDADLEGKAIVFLAPFTTPEEEARAGRWHAEAARQGRLFCTVDRPEACTFVNVAITRAPGLTMTIGTDGASPGTARRIREDLEALFADPRFARFVEKLATLRASLPRGERAARMAEAVKGFAVEAKLRFPAWLERGEDP
ncbi:Siroheme synthase / Precorrin-2 oxidase [Minicystis rosea]|nr:Siroheme synthase / Precorrin-2 oxidase [Minicystis rosea]